MIFITIASGQDYKASAGKVKKLLPSLVIADTVKPEHGHDKPNVKARLAKVNFPDYFPAGTQHKGPLVLMDADLELVNPAGVAELDSLIQPGADVAGVCWTVGKVFYPGQYKEVPPTFPALNSGFLWFKNITTARKVAAAWGKSYRAGLGERMERDEPNLAIALYKLGLTVQVLPIRFNSPKKEADTVFYHPAK